MAISAFTSSQSFTLKQGEETLASLADYSVAKYCYRTFASAEAAEKNMIRAIYAIGMAAEVYNG